MASLPSLVYLPSELNQNRPFGAKLAALGLVGINTGAPGFRPIGGVALSNCCYAAAVSKIINLMKATGNRA